MATSRRTRGCTDLARRKTGKQQDGDGGGTATVHNVSRSAHPQRNSSRKNKNPVSRPEVDESLMVGIDNPHTQLSSSPANRSKVDQPDDYPVGMATSGQRDAHTKEDSNSASRDLEGQRDSDGVQMAASSGPSTRARENLRGIDGNAEGQPETDEPQTASGNSEAQFNTTATGYADIQLTQGDPHGDTGSHRHPIDETSEIVNEGTLANVGRINPIRADKGEEPKNTGRLSTPHPTVCTSAVLTSRNAQPLQPERRSHMFPGWSPTA